MKSPKRGILFAAGALLAVAFMVLYFIVDPESSIAMPQCIFHRLTGFDCPGCGSQRMFHSLLHADFRSAWKYNPFLLCMIPIIAVYVWLEIFPKKTPRLFRIFHSTAMISTIGAAIILWGILRNI